MFFCFLPPLLSLFVAICFWMNTLSSGGSGFYCARFHADISFEECGFCLSVCAEKSGRDRMALLSAVYGRHSLGKRGKMKIFRGNEPLWHTFCSSEIALGK